MRMKKILRAAARILRWLIGLAAALAAFVWAANKEKRDEGETAEAKRREAEERIRSSSLRSIAGRYEGAGEAVDAGRHRFAARVKRRVIAAGGRRAGE